MARTKAIIVKKQHTNENDQILTCYTEEFGKITAIAKSVLKRTSLQSMHLDIFNLVDFELIDSKNMPIIASTHTESAFPNLKKSMPAIEAAGYFAREIDQTMFENERDDKMWSFLVKVFTGLDQNASDRTRLNDFFSQNREELIRVSGY
ncbi:MAG: repair protein RecO protein [Candidatus Yanofskybacteria bacterium GW2011_GWA2_44_10]|uniref:Repair protein RecO protein n=2 Tax=Candidatus Yanofskyibacteriota TaxID=1752733 RepID=A0A0G1L3H3_9BACT|nr:MAG: repair protein RecO protein [Candidatus Yanofskybacteria bacterium GW2011_GWA2_44_10]KKT90388.1 MAG: repair protein RecO protein [Candidatus Yanofskybacteria bacterium GW2011_GWB1_45_11]